MGKQYNQNLPKEVLDFFIKAGSAGGKKRWEKIPPEDRSAYAKRIVTIREEKRKLRLKENEKPDNHDQQAHE